MNLFLIVVGKEKKPVGENITRIFHQNDLGEIFFNIDQHRFWSNENGSVVYFGWEGHRLKFDLKSHFYEENGGMAAFNGHMWPRSKLWSEDRSWGEHLFKYLNKHGPLSTYEDFFGIFTGEGFSLSRYSWR